MPIIDENGHKIQGSLIQAYLDWPPTVNHYYTVARGRKILSTRGRDYKAEQVIQLRMQKIPRHDSGRFSINISAYPPDRRKRDLDNLLKPILDCLTDYGAIPDDSAIDEITIRRSVVEKPGLVQILIRRYDDDDR